MSKTLTDEELRYLSSIRVHHSFVTSKAAVEIRELREIGLENTKLRKYVILEHANLEAENVKLRAALKDIKEYAFSKRDRAAADADHQRASDWRFCAAKANDALKGAVESAGDEELRIADCGMRNPPDVLASVISDIRALKTCGLLQPWQIDRLSTALKWIDSCGSLPVAKPEWRAAEPAGQWNCSRCSNDNGASFKTCWHCCAARPEVKA